MNTVLRLVTGQNKIIVENFIFGHGDALSVYQVQWRQAMDEKKVFFFNLIPMNDGSLTLVQGRQTTDEKEVFDFKCHSPN